MIGASSLLALLGSARVGAKAGCNSPRSKALCAADAISRLSSGADVRASPARQKPVHGAFYVLEEHLLSQQGMLDGRGT